MVFPPPTLIVNGSKYFHIFRCIGYVPLWQTHQKPLSSIRYHCSIKKYCFSNFLWGKLQRIENKRTYYCDLPKLPEGEDREAFYTDDRYLGVYNRLKMDLLPFLLNRTSTKRERQRGNRLCPFRMTIWGYELYLTSVN